MREKKLFFLCGLTLMEAVTRVLLSTKKKRKHEECIGKKGNMLAICPNKAKLDFNDTEHEPANYTPANIL